MYDIQRDPLNNRIFELALIILRNVNIKLVQNWINYKTTN